ncbi:MAG TPA: glycosyltransferase [Terriglobales bacterium]|nr:glycosyltransferase [Terriglobales bacterium]
MNKLNIHIFAHSWISDWNHGNAHFLRGLAQALIDQGHKVQCYEPLGSWSLTNLVHEEGQRAAQAIDQFRRVYSELNVQFYNTDVSFETFVSKRLRDADLVLVHEWNEPQVVNSILGLKDQLRFLALFHDTHHRAYTNPREILRLRLDLFDGVLAFGEAIRKIYTDGFGIERAWTFHEAADVERFRPLPSDKDLQLVWVGNWGDDERTRELNEFLIGPAARLVASGGRVAVHGVRYPSEGLQLLKAAGVEFRGYLANLEAPRVYASSELSVHVPRRQYANGLSGVPTIRVFETLACGIPLICSPWEDAEKLFRPGEDYVCVPDGEGVFAESQHLLRDRAAREQLAANGLERIRQRHTCRHRAEQLMEIVEELQG